MSGDGPLVLVVEDDHGVRELLSAALAIEGFDVTCAEDGLEGLVKVRVRRPAVIVLDLAMPGVGGLRVLDELAEEACDVPVLVVTGDEDAAAQARDRLGDERVLVKPFDVDELAARLRLLATPAGGPPPGRSVQ